MRLVETKLNQLPEDLQKEVEDFIDFLISKRGPKKKKVPKLDWIGGLKEYRDQYTSVELQKKASEWSGEEEDRSTGDCWKSINLVI